MASHGTSTLPGLTLMSYNCTTLNDKPPEDQAHGWKYQKTVDRRTMVARESLTKDLIEHSWGILCLQETRQKLPEDHDIIETDFPR